VAAEPGQILSLLSHELRSPLGVVRGYLRLLDQQTELSANHRTAVAAALKASERCLELVAQASALGHLWRHEAKIARQPLHLNDLIPALAQTVKGADGQLLPVTIGAIPDRSISGDRALLDAALSSLVVAIHRAQPIAVAVTVSCHDERLDDREGVAIRIGPANETADTGADAPLDLRRGGLGLELPMALAIADAHEGRISERRTEHGTSVVVWLPVLPVVSST
jgi:signal transduction histidine kinase